VRPDESGSAGDEYVIGHDDARVGGPVRARRCAHVAPYRESRRAPRRMLPPGRKCQLLTKRVRDQASYDQPATGMLCCLSKQQATDSPHRHHPKSTARLTPPSSADHPFRRSREHGENRVGGPGPRSRTLSAVARKTTGAPRHTVRQLSTPPSPAILMEFRAPGAPPLGRNVRGDPRRIQTDSSSKCFLATASRRQERARSGEPGGQS
jgi:hypothetical protein